jgi:aspartate kinase
MSATFDELASLAEALSVLGHSTPRSFDTIAAFGEQLSSHLVAAFFKLRDIPAEHVDARDVFITDDNFMTAEPQTEAIAEAARELVQPMIQEGKVPVMGGFIGRIASWRRAPRRSDRDLDGRRWDADRGSARRERIAAH